MELCKQWSLAFDDRMPIYRQIILQFSRALVRGDIRLGDRIPSIRELSALLRVNTNTVQRVYQEMERDGMISSKRGTGYFITEDLVMTEKIRRDMTLDALSRFVEEMCALGLRDNDILTALESYMKGVEQSESCS